MGNKKKELRVARKTKFEGNQHVDLSADNINNCPSEDNLQKDVKTNQ